MNASAITINAARKKPPNAYIPKLTSEAGIAGFLRGHLGYRFASTKQAGAMTDAFIRRIRQFLTGEPSPVGSLQKGPAQRCKDPSKSKASGPQPSALEMPGCKRCLPLWSCSASNSKDSPINIQDANHEITRAFNQFDRAVADYLAQQKAA